MADAFDAWMSNIGDGVGGAAASSGGGMWSWLGNNANELKTFGTLVGGIGSGYGAYKQGQAMDQVNKLNLKIYDDEKKRQESNDKALSLGYANSTYGKGA